jgi:6-phosphogluconolactonase (cycloisomerase 2 family)
MSVAFHPSDKFAYVGDVVSNAILTFNVDPATGALTFKGPTATGMYPYPAVVDPSGMFVYVTNTNSNDIGAYTIDPASGTLTPAGTIAAGSLPGALAITAVIQ